MNRWLRETPLLAGIIAGCVGMWWYGRAFVPMDWPAGFDWERYLRETWAYMHPGTMNSTWLEPLYPYLLGNLGPELGWPFAGLLISSVASCLLVVGTGLLGRALGGPWVGAVAAISIPLTPQLSSAARWVNMYPLLSGFTALGLAGCVGFARWPKLPWAVLGGLGMGLAWAVDGRTITMLPGAILLAAMAIAVVPSRVRQVVLLGVFGLGIAVGPLLQDGLRVVPREDTAQVAEILRGIELSKLRNSPNQTLRQACLNEPSSVISPTGLLQPCAGALQTDNLVRVHEGLPWGLGATMWLLLCSLLPGNGGRRQSTMAVLALIPSVAMTWVMSRWIIVTPRYMMQVAAPAAVIAPLAAVQFWQTVTKSGGLGRFASLGALVAGVWLYRGGPVHPNPGALEDSSTYQMMAPLVQKIATDVGEGDTLLDCSESHVEVSLLPRVTHAPPNNHEGHEWARCQAWLSNPEGEGDGYIILGSRTQIPGLNGLSLPPPWVQVLRRDGQGQTIRLWKLAR